MSTIEIDLENWPALALLLDDGPEWTIHLCAAQYGNGDDLEPDAIKAHARAELAAFVAEQTRSRWIPVSDPPDEGVEVLAVEAHGECFTALLDEDGWSESMAYYPITPTHWQPLPEPPEGT